MSNQIAKLSYLVTADVSGLIAGLDKGSKQISQLAEWGTSGQRALAALVEEAEHGIEQVAHFKREADALGMSFEALQAVKLTAPWAAEGMTRGLMQMSKYIERFRDGAKEAMVPFAKLGLTMKDMEGSTEEIFGRISDAIRAMPTATGRLAAAREFFGKGAFSMMPLIMEGSEGMKKRQEALQSSTLSLTPKEIFHAGEADKAMKEFSAVMEATTMKIGAVAAPAFEGLLKSWSEDKGALGTKAEIGGQVVAGFITAAAALSDGVEMLAVGVKSAGAGVVYLAERFALAGAKLTRLEMKMTGGNWTYGENTMTSLDVVIQDLDQSSQKWLKTLQETRDWLDKPFLSEGALSGIGKATGREPSAFDKEMAKAKDSLGASGMKSFGYVYNQMMGKGGGKHDKTWADDKMLYEHSVEAAQAVAQWQDQGGDVKDQVKALLDEQERANKEHETLLTKIREALEEIQKKKGASINF
jgi:hypothetical protein